MLQRGRMTQDTPICDTEGLSLHQFRLAVGDGHQLAISKHGNPDARKAIVLHGGPGAGCAGAELDLFDLDDWQVALFDQRGCGESLPAPSTKDNTVAKLTADVEKVRLACFGEHAKVTLVGGSWGSALAMLAAIERPETVERIVLRGVFFGDSEGGRHIAEPPADIIARAPQWFEYYDDFIVPEAKTNGLIAIYDHIMQNGTYDMKVEAAKRFMAWDTAIAFPSVNEGAVEYVQRNPHLEIPITQIFMHFAAREFSAANRVKILNAQDALAGIPIDVIHGEMDWICPVGNAYALAAAYPDQTNLHVMESAGHAMGDPRINHAMRQIING